MKHLRRMIGPRARRYHGGLAALYVLGMLVTLGHVALEDHHSVLNHDHHHGHGPDHEQHHDHAPHGLTQADHHECAHSCCHLIHDTLPTQLPRPLQLLRTGEPARMPVTAMPTTPHLTLPTLSVALAEIEPPPTRAGVTTTAPGRAPPHRLHT